MIQKKEGVKTPSFLLNVSMLRQAQHDTFFKASR